MPGRWPLADQRVQQVQSSRKCSRRTALRIVMASSNSTLGAPAPEPAAEVSASACGGDAAEEAAPGTVRQSMGVIQLEKTAEHGRVLAMAPGVGLRSFTFAEVFGTRAPQASVYAKPAAGLTQRVPVGKNSVASEE